MAGAMLLRLIEYQDWKKDWNGRYVAAVQHYSQDCAVRYVRICANMQRHLTFEGKNFSPKTIHVHIP